MTPSRVDELLAGDVRDAWWQYLSVTQFQVEPRYSTVEPWAWNRLQAKLRTIETRRKALKREVRRS